MEDFVGGELPLAKLRRWSALDELDPPGSLLPNEGSHAQAKVFAAIWEGKGGLPAALPVLHSGLPQEDACFAAMALGALVDDRAAPQVDEDKQILRALLQVGRCCPSLLLTMTECPCKPYHMTQFECLPDALTFCFLVFVFFFARSCVRGVASDALRVSEGPAAPVG